MLHTVIFIGRSGCGKGTQADLLKERIAKEDNNRILYIETGDRFRKFIREDSYSSKLSREIYERDERQPDFLAGLMWGNELIEELEPHMHIVFDGVARSEPEARMLTTAMRFYKRERPTVIYLNVSRKWSEERLLSRGRQDDVNIGKIDKRLDWFDEDTLPSIEYFRTEPFYRFIEVDGEQSIQRVHNELISKYEYSAH